jgi:chemotaxis response regulator CheB
MRLDSSPKEHHTRPSIDVLFRSAAAAFGRFSIGVVLSGILRDGTSGLWHIKQRGGVAIVQDPLEAEFPGMPRSAIEQVAVDYVLPAAAIADKLLELARRNQASATRQSGPPEILIVEDEGLVAANIQEQLEELSYGVSGIARSGEEAMRNAAEKRPDLILMDVRLAGSMTGIEAARNIWERLQIPVVFITAHADLATLDNVSSTEHYGFVVKPFQSASLQAAVKLALDRRARELRHLPPRAES